MMMMMMMIIVVVVVAIIIALMTEISKRQDDACMPDSSLFCFISDVHQPLSQIRISLAASLGAGQIIFLAGIGATGNTVRSPFNVERGGG